MISNAAWPPAATCDASRKCILIVEDELLIRLMLSDGLRDKGYNVIEACNADEALTILQTAVPDILISDVRMPGTIDGLGLLRVVRETLATLPVVLTSGHLSEATASAEGAARFFPKPYSMEALFGAVEDLFRGS
jgi:DNA-binding NtrC family response regulator